jgi:hypothetical protein
MEKILLFTSDVLHVAQLSINSMVQAHVLITLLLIHRQSTEPLEELTVTFISYRTVNTPPPQRTVQPVAVVRVNKFCLF